MQRVRVNGIKDGFCFLAGKKQYRPKSRKKDSCFHKVSDCAHPEQRPYRWGRTNKKRKSEKSKPELPDRNRFRHFFNSFHLVGNEKIDISGAAITTVIGKMIFPIATKKLKKRKFFFQIMDGSHRHGSGMTGTYYRLRNKNKHTVPARTIRILFLTRDLALLQKPCKNIGWSCFYNLILPAPSLSCNSFEICFEPFL